MTFLNRAHSTTTTTCFCGRLVLSKQAGRQLGQRVQSINKQTFSLALVSRYFRGTVTTEFKVYILLPSFNSCDDTHLTFCDDLLYTSISSLLFLACLHHGAAITVHLVSLLARSRPICWESRYHFSRKPFQSLFRNKLLMFFI